MWTSAPSLTVDVSRRAAMRTARIRAAVKLASFSHPTAKSATVSDRRRTLCVCVCVLYIAVPIKYDTVAEN